MSMVNKIIRIIMLRNEFQIGPALKPPVGRDAGPIPSGMISGLSGHLFHSPLHGMSNDFIHSFEAVSLYC